MPNWSYSETVEGFGTIEAFAEAVQKLPVPWELETHASRFTANIERRLFGEICFGSVQFGPCTCFRAGADPERTSERYVCLTFQRQGVQSVSWQDRRVVAAPDELILWDTLEPMVLENDAPARAYNLWFPARLAERRIGNLGDFIGQKVSRDEAPARVLGNHLETVYAELHNLPDAARTRVMESLIDLIFACITPKRRESENSNRKAELLREAQYAIDQAADLNSISPAGLAEALGISVRYLQQVFTESGWTISGYVGKVRLDRTRDALVSQYFRTFSITEIAHWFGFFDSSHLNRSFKKAYGETPSEYRYKNS